VPTINNAVVYFVPLSDSEGHFLTARVMEAGQLSLSNIPPGTYRLLAFASPQKELDFMNPIEMRKYESKGIVLQLAPNQRATLPSPLVMVDEP
jgi:hypothetical protein